MLAAEIKWKEYNDVVDQMKFLVRLLKETRAVIREKEKAHKKLKAISKAAIAAATKIAKKKAYGANTQEVRQRIEEILEKVFGVC